MKNVKVIIIGAGPAGIACATQLKRYNIDSIILEKERIGGLLKNANLIENYLGFPKGITGPKFIRSLKEQVRINALNVVYDEVLSANYFDNEFFIKSSNNTYTSEYLIVASGTKPIVPIKLQSILNNRVFTEIHHLGKVVDKFVVIVGAGDCAFDYAMNLSSNNQVILLNRVDRIKANSTLKDRVLKNKNIRYIPNISLNKVEDDRTKLTLFLSNNKLIKADYLLLAVGREPNLDFIKTETLKNSKLFQIGDVKNRLFRQSSIAIGDGTFTAMKINSILNKEQYESII